MIFIAMVLTGFVLSALAAHRITYSNELVWAFLILNFGGIAVVIAFCVKAIALYLLYLRHSEKGDLRGFLMYPPSVRHLMIAKELVRAESISNSPFQSLKNDLRWTEFLNFIERQ